MITRRDFIKLAAATPIGIALRTPPVRPVQTQSQIERVGVGLFTIPKLLEEDFPGTMARLGTIGYKEVELFGPYPYTVPEVVASWEPIAQSIGLSQSGYYGHTPQQVRDILDANGLTSPSMHIDLGTLQTRLDEVAEASQVLGHRYAGIAAIPPELRTNLDDYRRIADTFNEIGLAMKEVGLQFLYHNHGYGLVEMEGSIPFNLILDRTDPDLVVMEMDVFWMTAGRADPVEYLNAYPGRFKLMHIKDMTELVRFEGDGGDSSQWIPLFPKMADAGEGVLDLDEILKVASMTGVQHFYLERDLAPDPDQTLKGSYQYLSSIAPAE